MRRAGIAAVVVGGALLLPGAAYGAPTAVSPVNASVGMNIHPTFQWALPSNERSSIIRIASKPDVTPEGRFFTENIEHAKAFSGGSETQYTSTQPLPAGVHWWTISSSLRTRPFTEYVTPPAAFAIAPAIGKPRVRITRYRFTRKLGVNVRITGNIPTALVRVKVYRGRRLVGRASERRKRGFITSPSTSFLTPKIRERRARRLKVVVSVSYGKTKRVARKTVRGV